MSHSATERLLLQPAPRGLALVQDLLNTRDIGRKVPDLLATVDLARSWLNDALPLDADRRWLIDLSDRDLVGLRALRSDVQNLIAGSDNRSAASVVTKLGLSRQPTGELRVAPTGVGGRRLASTVWSEIFLAQQADTWKRLKLCHQPACSSAFYDRSKNNSGVWHDVKMCGNAANLRASRARRKVATAGPDVR